MAQPALGVAVLIAALVSSPTPRWSRTSPARTADSTQVIPNDNRIPAGTLRGNVLSLRLVARPALWRPEGPDGPVLPIYAFAREERTSDSGSLIRFPSVGDRLRLHMLPRRCGSTAPGLPSEKLDSLIFLRPDTL